MKKTNQTPNCTLQNPTYKTRIRLARNVREIKGNDNNSSQVMISIGIPAIFRSCILPSVQTNTSHHREKDLQDLHQKMNKFK